MKTIKYLVSILLLNVLVSCGGDGSKSVTLTVDPQLGQLGNFISISDKEVTIKLIEEKEDGEEVKSFVSSMSIEVNKSVASDYSFSFSLVVEDEDHIEIADLPDFYLESSNDWNNQDFRNVLQKGNYRAKMHESQTIEEWKDDDRQEIWDKICKRGKYVVIKPSWSSAEYVPYNSKNEAFTIESSSSEFTDDDENELIESNITEVEIEEIEDLSSTVNKESIRQECKEAIEQYKQKTVEGLKLAKKVKEGDKDANLELLQISNDCTTLSAKILKLADECDGMDLIQEYQKINTNYLKELSKYK